MKTTTKCSPELRERAVWNGEMNIRRKADVMMMATVMTSIAGVRLWTQDVVVDKPRSSCKKHKMLCVEPWEMLSDTWRSGSRGKRPNVTEDHFHFSFNLIFQRRD